MKTIAAIGKIVAATTVALSVAAGAYVAADAAIKPVMPPQSQTAAQVASPRVAVATAPTTPTAPAAPQAPTAPAAAASAPDLATMLASANPDAGKAYAKTCAACHSFDKSGANKVGPNLYGIVGAKHAHMPGFKYSDAMKALADKVWTFEALDEYLRSPKTAIPGNRMAYAGIKSDKDRVNVIAWLRALSDKPEPLPTPKK
ncbi:MAG: cytochrome c family protein [Bdellovibrionales bacterium]